MLQPPPPASEVSFHLAEPDPSIHAATAASAATGHRFLSRQTTTGKKFRQLSSLTARNGVGVILKACLKDKVIHVIRCSDRIITLTLVIDGETVNVICAYAPQVGLSEVEKKTFWDSLDKVVREFPTDQRLILGEAFRSRVAKSVSTRVEALVSCDTYSIKDAAKDTLGVSIGTSKTHTTQRESWWLCEEVQAIVVMKQARFRELLSCREGNKEERLRIQERYNEAKRHAKIVVAQAKEKAYEDLYKKLDSKKGANDIFRIAKARERRRIDLGDICFIKDEEGRTIMDEEEIKKR
uniref:Cleavage/polyadenylation specificity factor, 25kDa subunit n=1 Tax=Tanacetum cinerariifolium TaxID=118510 RepID=A0A6L2LXW5_TANCI|nr:cleavage/polyadenylation specificity factor, 25kDa subunit [Tanacetum cinerariifolium]